MLLLQYLTPKEPEKALQLNIHAPEGSRDISQWVRQLWGHLLEHMLGPLPDAIQVFPFPQSHDVQSVRKQPSGYRALLDIVCLALCGLYVLHVTVSVLRRIHGLTGQHSAPQQGAVSAAS